LKPEQWGSPLVQEKYQEEKACDKRHQYRIIIIIIIIIIIFIIIIINEKPLNSEAAYARAGLLRHRKEKWLHSLINLRYFTEHVCSSSPHSELYSADALFPSPP